MKFYDVDGDSLEVHATKSTRSAEGGVVTLLARTTSGDRIILAFGSGKALQIARAIEDKAQATQRGEWDP